MFGSQSFGIVRMVCTTYGILSSLFAKKSPGAFQIEVSIQHVLERTMTVAKCLYLDVVENHSSLLPHHRGVESQPSDLATTHDTRTGDEIVLRGNAPLRRSGNISFIGTIHQEVDEDEDAWPLSLVDKTGYHGRGGCEEMLFETLTWAHTYHKEALF